MKTLENHTILYDEVCPMCKAYTGAFVKTGMLDKKGREPYQNMSPAWACRIDHKRAVNEIALIDRQTGEVHYGITSLFIILQNSFPVLKPLFRFQPFKWTMDKCYKFVSYNRRVIMPSARENPSGFNDPSFNRGYRLMYLAFTWLVTSCILLNYSALLHGVIPESNFYREFWICGGQILWQFLVVSFTNKNKTWDYLGTMMTVSFAGALLLLMVIGLAKLVRFSPGVFTVCFLLIVALMLAEHIRRVRILKVNSMLTFTWITYRIIILITIFMLDKIVLAGGSGYIGTVLCEYYKSRAKEIIVLSRHPHADKGHMHFVQWNGETVGDWACHLENCDLLINLSGKNVNCRYTKHNREEIFKSRLVPTSVLGEAINDLRQPPKVWINLASATIYRHAEDRFQDEDTGEIGEGFSVDVCKAWEKKFWDVMTPQTRKVVLRAGLVMGRKDGIVPRLRNLVLCGMGGKQGNGNQYISWIHEQDLARITEWVYYNAHDGEIYNCTSSVAIRNKDLMKLFRQAIGIPFGIPSPRWLLEIGAILIGTETELVLKSRWVYPKHLLEKGYRFLYEKPDDIIHQIFGGSV